MKELCLIPVLFFVWSCGSKKDEHPVDSGSVNTITDTINRTDANGLKQGLWKIADWKATEINHKQILVESGNYINNKRQGAWYFYDSTGNLNRVVEFENDFPVKR